MSEAHVMTQLREHFNLLANQALGQLHGDEQATLNLKAEDSLFLRFNGSGVRQNTQVQQFVLSLTLQSQGRTVESTRNFSGQLAQDLPVLKSWIEQARADAAVLPPDPHQVPVVNNGCSADEYRGQLLNASATVQAVLGSAQACDLAGLYAAGTQIRANRNSAGQDHWFASENFVLDYSLYDGPKAAKGGYAGTHWEPSAWAANLAQTKANLELLKRPKVAIKPGQYRSYFAPPAFAALVGILGWNALSAAAWKQGRCPLKKLLENEVSLSPLFSLGENFESGLSPRFNALGEVSATRLALIEQGRLQTLLVSSRSAKEYGLSANAADESESPRALEVAPGTLAQADILAALGTGLYLSNLHYLNWSDPVAARVTGMTRYACFWVENGDIVGPIDDLRWDESLLDALGPKLLALTAQTEIDPATETYYCRALGGTRVPGALIEGFTFTL